MSASDGQMLAELVRVQAVFQLRAIQAAMGIQGVTKPVTPPEDMWMHRGWKISVDGPVWQAVHKDYDGCETSGLCVNAETYKELILEIDCAQDDYEEANGQFGVGA